MAWVWALLPRLGPIAWTALLFPGIYMMVVAWGREAWRIGFGFLGMALLAGLGGRSGANWRGPRVRLRRSRGRSLRRSGGS
jgi:hypothetical protein